MQIKLNLENNNNITNLGIKSILFNTKMIFLSPYP